MSGPSGPPRPEKQGNAPGSDDRASTFQRMTQHSIVLDRVELPPAPRVVRRRVRTGCIICRERRVKCDEGRPTCDKCRKVGRECEYSTLARPRSRSRQRPSVDRTPGVDEPQRPEYMQSRSWSELSADARSHFYYFRDCMTYEHYALRTDAENFFKTDFVSIALAEKTGALLYAIIAFAAYSSIFDDKEETEKDMAVFLSYYNKTINLLQQSLRNDKPEISTVLTILQLARLEQTFGDWISTLAHHQAAHKIIKELYTPETIMQDRTGRMTMMWDMSFDILAGWMGGTGFEISQEWYDSYAAWYAILATENPADLNAHFGDYFGRLCLLSVKLTRMTKLRTEVSSEEFAERIVAVMQEIAITKRTIEESFIGTSNFVKEFPLAPPPQEGELYDFRDPKFVYSGELTPMNHLLMWIWSTDAFFMSRIIAELPNNEFLEKRMLKNVALTCKMFEALQYCAPDSLRWAVPSMSVVSLIAFKDGRQIDWFCRKHALVELMGRVITPMFRHRVSKIWGRDVTHWWIEDEEPPVIVKQIRDLVELRERPRLDVSATSVQDLSGLFSSLGLLDDDDSDAISI